MSNQKTSVALALVFVSAVVLAIWNTNRIFAEADTPRAAQRSEDEQKLLTAKYESASKLYGFESDMLGRGKTTHRSVYDAALRLRDSEVELRTRPDERVAAQAKLLSFTQEWERSTERQIEVGAATQADLEAVRFRRLTAELDLLRAKRAP